MSYTYERPSAEVRAAYAERLLTDDVPIRMAPIGHSILSEPLEMYYVGEGAAHIVCIGAHHGSEWMTAALLYRFLFDLCDAYRQDTPCGGIRPRFLLSRYTFCVLPMLNTDGCTLSLQDAPTPPLATRQVRMSGGEGFLTWQANARGVDLNHNYAHGHAEYKRMEAKLGIEAGRSLYSGEYPESEPETHALSSFVRTMAPRAVLSLHLGEDCVYFAPRQSAAVRRMAQRLGRQVGCEVHMPEGTAKYGGLCDYTGQTLGIPSFTLSLGAHRNPPTDTAAASLYMGLYGALFTLPSLL